MMLVKLTTLLNLSKFLTYTRRLKKERLTYKIIKRAKKLIKKLKKRMEMISFWIGTLNSIKRFQKQNKKHLEKKLTDSNGQDKTSFQELIHKKQDKL